MLTRLVGKAADLRRAYRPERLGWWLLILALMPYLLLRRWVEREPEDVGPERVVIIQFGGIGDALMLTPALRLLRQRFPGAQIDLALTHERVRETLEGHPFFRDVIPMERFVRGYLSFAHVAGGPQAILKAVFHFPRLLVTLAWRRYDLAIVYALSPQMEHLGGALTCAAGIHRRVGFGEDRHGFLHRSVPVDPDDHRVVQYLRVLKLLDVPLDVEAVDHHYAFPLSEEERSWAGGYLQRQRSLRRPLMAVHPGGADLAVPRRWPAEHFLAVARWFVRHAGGTVLLTGGPGDAAHCDPIASALGDRAVNTCGRLSIRQTAALLAACDLCLTNDTSALHLAAAVDVPHTVAVFGPTDPQLLVPGSCGVRYVQADLPCVPCAGAIINSETQPCTQAREGACLLAVRPEQAIEIIEEILRVHPSSHREALPVG